MCYISADLSSKVELHTDFWQKSSVTASWFAVGTMGYLEHGGILSRAHPGNEYLATVFKLLKKNFFAARFYFNIKLFRVHFSTPLDYARYPFWEVG